MSVVDDPMHYASSKMPAISKIPDSSDARHARMVPRFADLSGAAQALVAPETALDSISQTLKERGTRYGAFAEHANITQSLKKLFYYHIEQYNKGQCLTLTEREGIDMIFHKLGRIANGDPHYADSWHDIAGYAKLVEDSLSKE